MRIRQSRRISLGNLSDDAICSYISTNEEASLVATTFSSSEFNQRLSDAKKAAKFGPVFITEGGRPAHVLLSIEDYRKLTGGQTTLAEALAQPDVPDFDFKPPRIGGLNRVPDLF
jgi:prevent-host-death family protein